VNQIVPVSANALAQFERVRRELEVARTVDDIKDIRDKAEALRLYLKQAGESLEIQNVVAEIKLRAERRAGEILAEMERQGRGGDRGNQHLAKSHDGTLPTLAEIGISRKQSSRWQQIAAIPETVFEGYFTESRESHAELTTAALLRLAKRLERSARQQPSNDDSRPETNPSVNTGLYRLMHGDPRPFYDKLQARSVDCILTQPPSLKYSDSRSLYETLAREAVRLLYPGGALVLLVNQADLPEALALLTPHLRYQWTLACLAPEGSVARRVPSRSLLTAWQPALWFTHGDPSRHPWISDALRPVEKSGDFSAWADSELSLMRLIEALTNSRDLVLDPFMTGGAIGAAALRLYRRYVGISPDARIVAAAAERLAAFS
jgi:DNA methylase